MHETTRGLGDARDPRRRPRLRLNLSASGQTTPPGLSTGGTRRPRSVVRKAAGIEFVGWDPTVGYMIAEVEMKETPEIGVRREGGGIGPVNCPPSQPTR